MPKKTKKWTLRGAIVFLIVILAVPISIWFSSEKIEAAWWNDMWQYRKSIAVTNSSGGALTDFQVKILSNVDLSADITNGKIQSDLDDLRFTDINGDLLAYWIEDSTAASVDVWVKMSSVPTTGATAYMYYGNPSAGAYSDGNRVFEFFDDFSGSLNKWTIPGGCTATVISGYMNIAANTNCDVTPVYANNLNLSDAAGYNFEFKGKYTSGGSNRLQLYQRRRNANAFISRFWINGTGTTYFQEYNGSWDGGTNIGANNAAADTWYTFRAQVNGSNNTFFVNGASIGSGTSSVSLTPFADFTIGLGEYQTSVQYDDIRVRKYASADPSAAAPATEEKGVGPVAYWAFDEGYGTITQDGVSSGVSATGGTVQDIGGYRIHTFTSSGTFTVTRGGNVEVLVVGGGGGTGYDVGGGGGGGGVVYNPTKMVMTQSYTVTIGTGGASGQSNTVKGSNGNNSVFGDITALGGGGGGAYSGNGVGLSGGSGGGAGDQNVAGGSATQTNSGGGIGYGYPGGTSAGAWGGGGGGGAGGPGANGITGQVVNGGAGFVSSISGASVEYAKGGKGNSDGGAITATPANTGEGAMGTGLPNNSPYSGGAGVIIVRYPLANDGMITGAAWKTEDQCVSGKCLWFDGSGDYVSGPAGANLKATSQMTMSVWVKKLDATQDRILGVFQSAGDSQPWYALFYNGSALRLQLKDAAQTWGDVSSTAISLTNEWHQIAVTFNRPNITFYVDGKAWGTASWNYDIGTSASPYFYIGQRGDLGGGEDFKGFIDEPKIYNYARSAAQIKMDYNAGIAGTGGMEGAAVTLGGKSQKWLTDGLVGHWKMDESSGTSLTDLSGNGNTGTLTNMVDADWQAGKFGNSLYFDGTDAVDYVAVNALGSIKSYSTELTLSSWVKSDSAAPDQDGFLWKAYEGAVGGGDWSISTTADGKWRGFNSASSSQTVDTNWHHIVTTVSNAGSKIYVDGALAGSNTTTTLANNDTNSKLIIGTWYRTTSNGDDWNGKVDDVRIYNRALQPQEVADLYDYAPGPVAYWNMDERNGGSAYDLSGGGNTGTLVSNAAWVAGKYGAALDFNGGTDALFLTSTIALDDTANWTTSAWMKTTSSGTNTVISNSSGGPVTSNLALISSKIAYNHYDGTWKNEYGTSNIADGRWHYLTWVNYSNQTIDLYVDGRLESDGAPSVLTNNGPVNQIGKYWGTASDATIDDVKIYNYARTAKQITEDMNGGHPVGGSPVGSQVGYWKFEEGHDTTANNSGSGGSTYNGTITGATWSNDGKFGKALDFVPASDPQINLGSGSGLNESSGYTISTWIYPDSFSTESWPTILNKSSQSGVVGFMWVYQSGGNVIWQYANGATSVAKTITCGLSTGAWQHLVLVHDRVSKNFHCYVNGIRKGTTSYSDTALETTTGSAYIGTYQGSADNSYHLDGKLDEYKIYNYAITADEVALDYNQGKSMQLGSTGTDAAGLASNSADRVYCPPGDTTASCGPVAEWNFEERNGANAYDTSGNGLTGSITSATWAQGKTGGGLNLSGSTQYVTVADNAILKPASAVTVEVWFNTRDKTAQQKIVSKTEGSGYQLSLNENSACPASTLCFLVNIGGVYYAADYAASNLVNDTWYHMAGVYNGSTVKLYLNGREVDSVTQSGTITHGAYPVCIGSEAGTTCANGGGNYFNGKIDGVKIYAYGRSAAQVAWDYNRGGPVGWWKMDECQGGTINDSSGFGNAGTWYGTGGGTQTAVGTCTTSGTAWYNGVSGKINSSLNFDGADDYVGVTHNSMLEPASVTVSAWVNLTSQATRHLIVTKWNGYTLEVNSTGYPYFQIWNGAQVGNTSSAPLTFGSWAHIVGTFDDSTKKVKTYLNGVETATITTGNSISYGGAALEFSDCTYNCAKGKVDDVRVYNYAMTPQQIKDLYNGGAVSFK